MRNVLTRMMNESYFNDDIWWSRVIDDCLNVNNAADSRKSLSRLPEKFATRNFPPDGTTFQQVFFDKHKQANTNTKTNMRYKYIFSYKCHHHLLSAFLWQRQIQITSSNYSTLMKLKSNHISGDFGWKAYSDHPSIWIPQHPILPQSKQLDRKVIFYIYVAQYV